jgi:hypothetical protein
VRRSGGMHALCWPPCLLVSGAWLFASKLVAVSECGGALTSCGAGLWASCTCPCTDSSIWVRALAVRVYNLRVWQCLYPNFPPDVVFRVRVCLVVWLLASCVLPVLVCLRLASFVSALASVLAFLPGLLMSWTLSAPCGCVPVVDGSACGVAVHAFVHAPSL